jgi:hypothetical protein
MRFNSIHFKDLDFDEDVINEGVHPGITYPTYTASATQSSSLRPALFLLTEIHRKSSVSIEKNNINDIKNLKKDVKRQIRKKKEIMTSGIVLRVKLFVRPMHAFD